MGQCYSTYLKLRYKDEDGAKKALQNYLVENSTNGTEGREGVFEYIRSRSGLDPDTMDGLLRHFYTGYECDHKWTRLTDPDILSGDFNANYSWESIMMEAFQAMAPFLEDGSTLKIYPDFDYDLLEVRDGVAVQLH